jgi:hypothetical protein
MGSFVNSASRQTLIRFETRMLGKSLIQEALIMPSAASPDVTIQNELRGRPRAATSAAACLPESLLVRSAGRLTWTRRRINSRRRHAAAVLARELTVGFGVADGLLARHGIRLVDRAGDSSLFHIARPGHRITGPTSANPVNASVETICSPPPSW